ncbi:MAG: T9SS type A sorting domain-containing protein, partial [Ignavibacteriaceae bacterium]
YAAAESDAYAYYTWQANVPDDPFAKPPMDDELLAQGFYVDPGTYNLATSQGFAVFNFVNEKTVGVGDYKNPNNLPVDFSLDQNFPNPFNPSTTIRINVAEVTPVTLRIYNALGQLITTLINDQTLSVGSHLVSWNAGAMASGTYFYSLQAGGKTITKKMMLVK